MKRKINNNGQITIPAELREKYGLQPGESVEFIDYGSHIGIVSPSEAPAEEALPEERKQEQLKKRQPGTAKGLLEVREDFYETLS